MRETKYFFVQSSDPKEINYTISGLVPFATYDISVAAKTIYEGPKTYLTYQTDEKSKDYLSDTS